MRIRIGRRTAKVAVVGAFALGAMGLATGGAYAAGPGGVESCPNGSVCLYYNSPGKGWGSFENWSPGQSVDLYFYTFAHWANGSGYGLTVGADAASIVNNTGDTVEVDLASGGFITFAPQYSGSLQTAWNNDAYMRT